MCGGGLLLQQYNYDDFKFELAPINVNKFGGNTMLISYDISTYLLTTSFVTVRLSDPTDSQSTSSIYSLVDIVPDTSLPKGDENAYLSIFLGTNTYTSHHA